MTIMVVSNNEWCFYYPVLPNVEISSDQLEYVYGKKDNTSIPLEFRKIQNKTPYFEKRYAEAICKVELNEKYAMLLTKTGKVYLHPINDQYFSDPNGHIMMFPETFNNSEPEYTITDATLTNYFLVFSTDTGKILHYDLEEFLMINEFNNANPIHKLVHQPGIGNKLIFIDSNYNAFITSPLSDVSILIPSWTKNFKGALWETNPQPGINVFVAWTESSIFTFSFNSMTLKGPQCYQVSLGPTHLPYGFNPIYFSQGRLICQSLSGKMETVVLNSHKSYTPEKFLTVFPTEAEQGAALKLLYVVGKKEVLWSLYPTVKSSTAWLMLAEALLKSLEVKAAKRIYRQILGDVGMVMNLERIEVVEERIELLGHIAVLFEDFNLAQVKMIGINKKQCFLNSSQPKEALYLRMDLLDWEQALQLATKFAPEELSTICYEYACQYEMDGKYGEAHTKYEQAIQAFKEYNQNNSELADHGFLCEAGLIRMTMAVGDLPKGMAMLSEVTNKTLLEDCVEILESLKQYSEAGILLERAGLWERAAECWIKSEGQYAEAAGAYERAQDYDSVIRILVDQLHDIEGGAILVRKTQARESAKQLAAIFLKERNFEATIEFYLIAGLQSQAFELAKQQDYMVYFGSLVKDEASTDLLSDIAQYFEFKGNYLEAGKYHLHALHYSEALKMFLQCPVLDGTPIDLAINTIGEAKNDSLTHELIDYLMGERDGVPKDAKYIFKLYMSLGQFKEAARTAVIIAREEQVLGNYRAAHDLLFDNYRQLKLTGASIPAELNRMLMLIHSYILVKTLVRIDEHLLGAQMLMRVSNHISKFPAHIVPILTSTVIECHRAGLKKEAFDYASMLMRPEYRQKVDAKFKRKIEQIIRRPEKEEVQPNYTPCPYCDAPVMETSLDCTECKSNIPYCIATCGFDLIVEDIRIIEHPLEKVPKYDESASEIVRKETNFGTGGLAA
ncbi:WD repeat-containing protein 19 [Globomyces sp. JEL0801]|nr:WD repeat-containing protein 19 [Globomyces sp. JEL0801]